MSRRTFLTGLAGGAVLVAGAPLGLRSAVAAPGGGSDAAADGGVPTTVAGVVAVTAAGSGAVATLGGVPVTTGRPLRLSAPVSAVALELPAGTDRAWLRGDGPGGATGWMALGRGHEGPDGAAAVTAVTELAWVRAVDVLEVAVPHGSEVREVRVHLIDTLGLTEAAAVGPAAVAALLAALDGPGAGSSAAAAGLATTWVGQALTSDPRGFAEAMPGVAGRTATRWQEYLWRKVDEVVPGRDPDPEPAPRPSNPRPPVVRRRDWGAAAPRSNHATARPRAIVLHHTVTRNDYTRSESPAILRAIQHHHQRTMGWSDVGYNLLVDRFGQVFEGRAGGLEAGVVGAHARGYNTGTVGIAVIGNHEAVRATRAARDGAARTVGWQARVHGISLREGARAQVGGRSIPTFLGHRDVGSTACPGRHLVADMPAIRRAAAS